MAISIVNPYGGDDDVDQPLRVDRVFCCKGSCFRLVFLALLALGFTGYLATTFSSSLRPDLIVGDAVSVSDSNIPASNVPQEVNLKPILKPKPAQVRVEKKSNADTWPVPKFQADIPMHSPERNFPNDRDGLPFQRSAGNEKKLRDQEKRPSTNALFEDNQLFPDVKDHKQGLRGETPSADAEEHTDAEDEHTDADTHIGVHDHKIFPVVAEASVEEEARADKVKGKDLQQRNEIMPIIGKGLIVKDEPDEDVAQDTHSEKEKLPVEIEIEEIDGSKIPPIIGKSTLAGKAADEEEEDKDEVVEFEEANVTMQQDSDVQEDAQEDAEPEPAEQGGNEPAQPLPDLGDVQEGNYVENSLEAPKEEPQSPVQPVRKKKVPNQQELQKNDVSAGGIEVANKLDTIKRPETGLVSSQAEMSPAMTDNETNNNIPADMQPLRKDQSVPAKQVLKGKDGSPEGIVEANEQETVTPPGKNEQPHSVEDKEIAAVEEKENEEKDPDSLPLGKDQSVPAKQVRQGKDGSPEEVVETNERETVTSPGKNEQPQIVEEKEGAAVDKKQNEEDPDSQPLGKEERVTAKQVLKGKDGSPAAVDETENEEKDPDSQPLEKDQRVSGKQVLKGKDGSSAAVDVTENEVKDPDSQAFQSPAAPIQDPDQIAPVGYGRPPKKRSIPAPSNVGKTEKEDLKVGSIGMEQPQQGEAVDAEHKMEQPKESKEEQPTDEENDLNAALVKSLPKAPNSVERVPKIPLKVGKAASLTDQQVVEDHPLKAPLQEQSVQNSRKTSEIQDNLDKDADALMPQPATITESRVQPPQQGTDIESILQSLVCWLRPEEGLEVDSDGESVSKWRDTSPTEPQHDFVPLEPDEMQAAMAEYQRKVRTTITKAKQTFVEKSPSKEMLTAKMGPYIVKEPEFTAVSFPCALVCQTLTLRNEMTLFFVLSPSYIEKFHSPLSIGQRFFGVYPTGQLRFHEGHISIKTNGGDLYHQAHEEILEGKYLIAGYRFEDKVEIAVNGQSFGLDEHSNEGDVEFPPGAVVTLGGTNQDCGFYGSVAEVMIFGKALDTSEEHAVFTYLSKKYSIPLVERQALSTAQEQTGVETQTGNAEQSISAVLMNKQIHPQEPSTPLVPIASPEEAKEVSNAQPMPDSPVEPGKPQPVLKKEDGRCVYNTSVEKWLAPSGNAQKEQVWKSAQVDMIRRIKSFQTGGNQLKDLIRSEKEKLESLRHTLFCS